MADFSNLTITEKGRLLLADVQAGGELDATRLVMGSGDIPVGKTAATMTGVVYPVISLEIDSKERTPDGKVIFGGYYLNAEVTEAFYFKEFALYARAIYRDEEGNITSTGDEMLYAYGNAGNTADLIPAYTTGAVVEKHLEMVSYVGNETEVNLSVESNIYVSMRTFEKHASRHSKGGADPIAPADIGAATSEEVAGLRNEVSNISQTGNTHTSNKSNPHGVTASQVGLGNVNNTSDADKPVSTAQATAIADAKKAGTDAQTNLSGHIANKNNPHGVTPAQIGAVNKNGDTVNGDLNVNGAFAVERSDSNRKARTVAHNNADKEVDFQNYGDDSNYVSVRVATEAKGIGDAVKVTQMSGGQFSAFTVLHTGNKEKIFTFGADDLEAGSTPLGNGQLHFVYE